MIRLMRVGAAALLMMAQQPAAVSAFTMTPSSLLSSTDASCCTFSAIEKISNDCCCDHDVRHSLRRKGMQLCLSSSPSSDDNGNNDESNLPIIDNKWTCPNNFQDFLNQCSIQSLVFLMNSLRDRQTALWLEEFTEPTFQRRTKEKAERDEVTSKMAKAAKDATAAAGIEDSSSSLSAPSSPSNVEIRMLTYHGLGLMNTTKFPTWDSYFQQLLDQPVDTYTIASSNAYVPDYELEINPPSICTRLISVREQIAREWRRDLDVIADMGGQIMDNYWLNQDMQLPGFKRPNLMFLEMSPDSTNDYMPSPLRKGNFDLLLLLTTQESIHRILNNASANSTPEVDYLQKFYMQRIGTHFTGSQWYGRADDFLEELLMAGPTRVQQEQQQQQSQSQSDGDDNDALMPKMIEPLNVVEMILEERERVADEWLEEITNLADAHMSIKRIQLNRLMGVEDSEVRGAFE